MTKKTALFHSDMLNTSILFAMTIILHFLRHTEVVQFPGNPSAIKALIVRVFYERVKSFDVVNQIAL